MTSRWHRLGIVAVLLMAAVLRFDGITRVGIQFEDESAYATDARLWHRCARVLIDPIAIRAAFQGDKTGYRRRMDELGVDFGDRYDKPSQGFTFLGALAMFAVGDRPAALLVVNALCGTLAVLVLYGLGRILFNPSVGLVAAFLFALSPYHLFYCRSALVDASAGAFCLLGVFFWALGRRRRWPIWRTYGLGGLAMGYSIICHYRFAYVVPILLAVEWFADHHQCSDRKTARPGLGRLTSRWRCFFVGLVLPALAFEAAFRAAQLVALLADAYFPVESYFQGVWSHAQVVEEYYGAYGNPGRVFTLNLEAARAYAGYFLHWHGPAAFTALVFGIVVVLRAKRTAKLAAFLVLVTIILLSLQPHRVARGLSAALPYLFLCMAAGITSLAAGMPRRIRLSTAWTAMLFAVAIALPSLPGLRHILHWRSELPDLCAWLADQGAGRVVVGEDPRKYELYLKGTSIEVVSGKPHRVTCAPAEAPAALRGDEVRWIIADPQRWHYRDPRSKERDAVFHWWRELEELLLREGPPVVTFDHLRDHRWAFLAEGPGPDYLEEMAERNDGALKVFELLPDADPVNVTARTGR